MADPFYGFLHQAAQSGENCALGIITGVKGSSPQKAGAKALFFQDGRIAGTMGGGCLEAEIQQRAVRSIRTGVPESFDLVLDHDFGWDDGLICGGKVNGVILPGVATKHAGLWERLSRRTESVQWGILGDYSISQDVSFGADVLYRERVDPPQILWIAGAGHISQAIAPLALAVDFQVTVFDDRLGWANRSMFPEGVDLRVDYWEELFKTPLPERPVYGLIMTQGHQHDTAVLREWIRRPFQFLGMIGSRRKWRIVREGFLGENLATEEELDGVHCPVGVSIGSVTPREIAVSVVAQLIQKRQEARVKASALAGSPGSRKG